VEGGIEARLSAGLKAMGLELAQGQVDALLTLVTELCDWNTRFNLTAIDHPPDVVDKHLLDSLAILKHLKGLTVADVGTGAGFPGLPLAIADLDRRFTLVESTGKKVTFIRHACTMLRLPNVEVFQGRAEALKPRKPFDSVVARALGPLAEFVRVAGHLAGPRGRLLAMKGRVPDDELKALPTGWKAFAIHPVAVPGLEAERCLVELGKV
jgi:16S rRNA (guanine527-N7)-methyltransferase